MKILIDTNILLPLENVHRPLPTGLAEFVRGCRSRGYLLYLHPAQYCDLQRDWDVERRNVFISRAKDYLVLEDSSRPTPEITFDLGWTDSSENDTVVNRLLYSVFKKDVDILLTEDLKIHRKAFSAGIGDQVYHLDHFLEVLREKDSRRIQKTLVGINHRPLSQIDVKQPFFDSLREGYHGFDDWFSKASKDGRFAWCFDKDGVLDAICVYKTENQCPITDDGKIVNGSLLKLCTLKVGEGLRGRKYGEKFFKTAFNYMRENSLDFVYLHTNSAKHPQLVSLCEEYGFEFVGQYKGDDVYLKRMFPNARDVLLPPIDFARKFFPYFKDGKDVSKYLVPIKKGFHEVLFSETSDFSQGLFRGDLSAYTPAENCLRKAYISRAKIRSINKGDLVFFYRSGDRQSVECVGVVEQAIHCENSDQILSLVSKRTVFTKKQLKQFDDGGLVILFLDAGTFPPVSLETLKCHGLKAPVQTIRKLEDDIYRACFAPLLHEIFPNIQAAPLKDSE